jgi:hypothetical protein
MCLRRYPSKLKLFCYRAFIYLFFNQHQWGDITLFGPIAVFNGTNNILWNIPHIEIECEEYYAKYCQSHKTLLWV